MRNLILVGAAVAAVAGCASAPTVPSSAMRSGEPAIDVAYTAAIADASRPPTDTSRDADRKPAETLAFAHIKSGNKVADFVAGGGYFTRLFSGVVGPKGRVYAIEPSETSRFTAKAAADLQTYATTHSNVTVIVAPAMESLKLPESLDVFWISQNYHDLKDKFFGPVDTAAFNKAVYAALKPGGIYIVLDHAAAPGSPADVTETLHRIDPEVVRREVEAAGFRFDSESKILANPADPHTARVFDASIRGKTDQFIYKFRKPRG
jgi:predicted methyltransferase